MLSSLNKCPSHCPAVGSRERNVADSIRHASIVAVMARAIADNADGASAGMMLHPAFSGLILDVGDLQVVMIRK